MSVPQPYKVCSRCGFAFPLVEGFHRDRTKPDGRASRCKLCRCAAEQARYAEKADSVILPQKAAYYARERDEIIEKRAAWRSERRAELAASERERYEREREKILARRKLLREQTRDDVAAA